MSAQDKRVLDAIEAGVTLALDQIKAPLERELGDPAGWIWEAVDGPIGEAIAKGIILALGALGVETGRVKVTAAPGSRVKFEVLPPIKKDLN